MSIAGYLHEFAARCGPVVGHSLDTSITLRLHLDVALASEELDAERAVSDHEIVERAIGAIMHLNNCTDTQARDLIEHAALAREVTKRDVAATILGALVPAVADDLA